MDKVKGWYRTEGELDLDLPIVEVKPGLSCAIFNPRGKTKLNAQCAKLLAARMPAGVEVLLMAAGKAEGLLQALSDVTGRPAVVAVKEIKPYMYEMMSFSVQTITSKPQTLHMDADSLDDLRGKNVAIVDDVVSTGATIEVLKKFIAQAGGRHIATMAVFTEGDQRGDVIALGHLPLF